MNIIETQNLTRRFGRMEALHGIDLAVPTGCVMALLTPYLNIFNGETVQLEKVPSLDFEEFRETLLMLTEKGGRI